MGYVAVYTGSGDVNSNRFDSVMQKQKLAGERWHLRQRVSSLCFKLPHKSELLHCQALGLAWRHESTCNTVLSFVTVHPLCTAREMKTYCPNVALIALDVICCKFIPLGFTQLLMTIAVLSCEPFRPQHVSASLSHSGAWPYRPVGRYVLFFLT